MDNVRETCCDYYVETDHTLESLVSIPYVSLSSETFKPMTNFDGKFPAERHFEDQSFYYS